MKPHESGLVLVDLNGGSDGTLAPVVRVTRSRALLLTPSAPASEGSSCHPGMTPVAQSSSGRIVRPSPSSVRVPWQSSSPAFPAPAK